MLENGVISEGHYMRELTSVKKLMFLPDGGGFATSNKTVAVSMSLSLNLVKSMP